MRHVTVSLPVHVGLTAQLIDAFAQHVQVLFLFLGVLGEFLLHRIARDAGRYDGVIL